MVTGSLDVGCHVKDLVGHCLVLYDSGQPGATMGNFTGHVLVGVVVTQIRSGLLRCMDVPNFQIYAAPQPAG